MHALPFPLLGLSGGIAAGKSFVARCLVERGWVVIDADALAREVLSLPLHPQLGDEEVQHVAQTIQEFDAR